MKGISDIKRIVFKTFEWLRQKHRYNLLVKEYKQIASRSATSIDHYVEGETEYLKKWKSISKFVSEYDYRLYSQYIGQNPNILPEYVMRNVIEPLFHPSGYLPFYNDKNMYDKLLPKDYLAQTLFRCIDGVYYGGGVQYRKSKRINRCCVILPGLQ